MADVSLLEETETYVAFALHGALDIGRVNALEAVFSPLVLARRKMTIFDLTNVPLAPSVGLGFLVGIARGLGRHGVRVALVGVAPIVERSLRLSALDTVFAIAPDLAAARRALGVA